MAVPRQSR